MKIQGQKEILKSFVTRDLVGVLNRNPTQPFMDGEFGSFELGCFDGFEPSTEIYVI